jgi:hypothetical protein
MVFDSWRFGSRQYSPKPFAKSFHRAFRIIGRRVWRRFCLVFFADGCMLHVCGNSEPVSAL